MYYLFVLLLAVFIPVFGMDMDIETAQLLSCAREAEKEFDKETKVFCAALDTFCNTYAEYEILTNDPEYQLVLQLGKHCTAQFNAIEKKCFLQQNIELLSGMKWHKAIKKYRSEVDCSSVFLSAINKLTQQIDSKAEMRILSDFVKAQYWEINGQKFTVERRDKLLFLISKWLTGNEYKIIADEQEKIKILVASLYPNKKVVQLIEPSELYLTTQVLEDDVPMADTSDARKALRQAKKDKKKTNKTYAK